MAIGNTGTGGKGGLLADEKAVTRKARRGRLMRNMLTWTVMWAAILLGAGTFSSLLAVPDFLYKSLDYQVRVLDNGDLKVVQRMTMRMNSREDSDGHSWPHRQIYWQYNLDRDKLTGITGISVRDVTNGRDYTRLPGRVLTPDDADGLNIDWDTRMAGHWYIADPGNTKGTNGANPSGTGLVDDGSTYSCPQLAGVRLAVDSKCGYDGTHALSGDARTVELGFDIPTTRHADDVTFEIAMTFEGTTTAYDDVASLWWEPIGEDNATPISKLHATVTYPEGVGADNSWAWLHYSGAATKQRGPGGSLEFTASDIRAGQWVDLVTMFDVDATKGVARKVPGKAHDRIMAEETQVEERDQARSRMVLGIWAAVGVAAALGTVLIVMAAIRSRRRSIYRGDIDYWREGPAMSPASAAILMSKVDPAMAEAVATGRLDLASTLMSATVLSLASKGAICLLPGESWRYAGFDVSRADPRSTARHYEESLSSMPPGSCPVPGYAAMLAANRAFGPHGEPMSRLRIRGRNRLPRRRPADPADTWTMVIRPVCWTDRRSLRLSPSEEAALAMIETAARRLGGATVFDLNQMASAYHDWREGYLVQKAFGDACEAEYKALRLTRDQHTGAATGFACVFTLIVSMLLGHIMGAGGALIGSLSTLPVMLATGFLHGHGAPATLVDPRSPLVGQAIGLRRYLLDFSMFQERGVADLALWDRYLVYATAFGVSGRVMEQLWQACPQLDDPAWLDAHADDSPLYWSYRRRASRRRWGHDHSSSGSSGPWDDPSPGGGWFDSGPSANAGDIGASLGSSFSSVQSTIASASPAGVSGGSFSGGGGSSGGGGGSGGGSSGSR